MNRYEVMNIVKYNNNLLVVINDLFVFLLKLIELIKNYVYWKNNFFFISKN